MNSNESREFDNWLMCPEATSPQVEGIVSYQKPNEHPAAGQKLVHGQRAKVEKFGVKQVKVKMQLSLQ
jgi:hypothetical protein